MEHGVVEGRVELVTRSPMSGSESEDNAISPFVASGRSGPRFEGF